jgi:hypothetical protein
MDALELARDASRAARARTRLAFLTAIPIAMLGGLIGRQAWRRRVSLAGGDGKRTWLAKCGGNVGKLHGQANPLGIYCDYSINSDKGSDHQRTAAEASSRQVCHALVTRAS